MRLLKVIYICLGVVMLSGCGTARILYTAATDANLNEKDRALFQAIMMKDEAKASAALEAGANPNSKNPDSGCLNPFLMHAVFDDKTNIAALLLDAGAKVDARNLQDQTALMWAASDGNVKMVVLLLKHGADPMRLDGFGESALQKAEEENHIAVIQALKKACQQEN